MKVLRMEPSARRAYAEQFAKQVVRVRTSYLRKEELVQTWAGRVVCVAGVESGSVSDVIVLRLAGSTYRALPLSIVLDIERA